MRRILHLLLLALCIALAGPAEAADPPRVAVLCYHRFHPTRPGATTITTPVFAAQLASLADRRIPVLPLRQVVEGLASGNLPRGPAVAITVDDGHESVYTEMFPLIRRYRVPVTLFIYPAVISYAPAALTWDQLAEMEASGLVDVESHTFRHPDFRRERARRGAADYAGFVARELTLSRGVLEHYLGHPVDILAWPYGIVDAGLERAAALAGYKAAFALNGLLARPGDDMEALPRIMIGDADRGARFAYVVEHGRQPRPAP